MNDLNEFVSFRKIPRLRRGCVITEKIDGTNAQVVVPADPSLPLRFGSRNRWITSEADNYGFARWGEANAEALREFLGPGRHYGEWWGSGIQRRYDRADRTFSLFNTGRWRAVENGVKLPAGVDIVPILYQGDFTDSAVDRALQMLRDVGSIAAPGYMNPEGIVVFHQASGSMYKYTLDGDGHKG